MSDDERIIEMLKATHPYAVLHAERAVARRYGTCTCGKGPWSPRDVCGNCGGQDFGFLMWTK